MPGRQSTGPPSTARPKSKKRTAKRTLNALAIAEQQHPAKAQLPQNRLGVAEQDTTGRKRSLDEENTGEEGGSRLTKRRRAGDKDRYGNDIEGGSDSEGNEWTLGQVDSEDDSDLDSDAAMGESDEEKFEAFTFRGSSSTGKTSRAHKAAEEIGSEERDIQEFDLSENGVGQGELGEDEDSLGDDAIDLADALDGNDEGSTGTESESESDQADFGFSDTSDQEDAADPKKLAFIGDMISNLNSSEQNPSTRPKSINDGLESQTPSEFGLRSSQKLTLADLQATVTDPGLRKSLKLLAAADTSKPSSKRSGIPKKLEVPLAKRQQDRLDRVAAYEKSKETLNRWIDTVKHNRRAEHLSFPLKDPNSAVAQGGHRMVPTTHSKPVTELEGVIQNILQASGLAPTNNKNGEDPVDDFADLPTNSLSLEQVQARRAELRRARELLFREEKRAKRIKKIKSKSYRKVHRKERERNAEREKVAMEAAGIDNSEEEQERNDRRRAEERMGQRHRESRWAKSVKNSGRAAWDEDARSGVTEMARRGEELRKRIEGRTVENDDDAFSESESSSDNDDDEEDGESSNRLLDRLHQANSDQPNGNKSTLSSMPFMQKASSLRRAQNDAEAETIRRELNNEDSPSEEEPSSALGRRSYGPAKPNAPQTEFQSVPRNEFEERPPSDDENEIRLPDSEEEDLEVIVNAADPTHISKPKQRQPISRTCPTKNPLAPAEPPSSNYTHNPWLSTSKPNRKPPKDNPSAPAIISSTLPPKPRSALKGSRAAAAASSPSPILLNDHPPDSASDTDDASATESHLPPPHLRNRALIARAFAGDAVVTDFSAEKNAVALDEDTKVIDTTLPGWGSWVGAGLNKRDSKHHPHCSQTTVTPGIAPDARKDAKLAKVIINEKRVKKNGRYLASSLPHPFETRGQYERSLRLPVGPEWTTKETFQGMTRPRVVVRQGVIGPMWGPGVHGD